MDDKTDWEWGVGSHNGEVGIQFGPKGAEFAEHTITFNPFEFDRLICALEREAEKCGYGRSRKS